MDIETKSKILKALRAMSGKTQREIANAAGIATNSVVDAEMGVRCTNRTWEKVLAVFGEEGYRVDTVMGLTAIILTRKE